MGRDKVKARVMPPEKPPLKMPRGIRPTPMTDDEYKTLARGVARDEIMEAAQALGIQFQTTIHKALVPVHEQFKVWNQHFEALYGKCNELDIHVHALVEVLVAKELMTKDEVRDAAKKVAEAMVARQEAMKKAAQAQAEAQAAAKAAGEATAEAPDEAPCEAPAEAPAEEAGDGDGGASSKAE